MGIKSRSSWGAAPASACTRQDPATLDGAVIHWFGSPTSESDHADCPAQLRSVQNFHMNISAEKYVDIAYNFAVCPHGTIYALRGWNCRSGANGTSDTNRRYLAYVVMMGSGDVFTAEAKASLSVLIRKGWARGVGKEVRPHGSITGSSCPGDLVKAWMKKEPWAFKYVTRYLVRIYEQKRDGEGNLLSSKLVSRKFRSWAWLFARPLYAYRKARGFGKCDITKTRVRVRR